MTQPAPNRWGVAISPPVSLFLRIVAVAAVIAIFIASFLCLDHVTNERIATIGISTGVLGAILIII